MVTITIAFMWKGPQALTSNNAVLFKKGMLLTELNMRCETLAGLYNYLLLLEAVTLKYLKSGTIRLSLSSRNRASPLIFF